jgi:3-deoxy-D-manno-octulosonate 8-phosphate phosphatase (KDO 8-P phosphatase)
MRTPQNVNTKNQKAKTLCAIFDVDGVMTTGQFIYSISGKQFKVFGAHDHDGIKMIARRINVEFVTADKNGLAISKKRIEDDMGFPLHLVGEAERFEFISGRYGFKNTIYMADGIFDVPILRASLFSIAPKNARIEARRVVDYITPSISGEGAVLDACIKIMSVFKIENK